VDERNLAVELSLLATEVDSLAKALVQARAELAREAELRSKADTDAEQLRQQLRHARRRATTAERELAKLTAGIQADAHAARVRERELQARLDQAEQANALLRHEVEEVEGERLALEQNLKDVLGNLRHAAQKAAQSRVALRTAADEATHASGPADNGW
jgi:predicted  nucleic acid-binding Zn-ribbon protein